MYQNYNPNPNGTNVGDCVIRALTKALNVDWETAYWAVAIQGGMNKDMPTSNAVWHDYLRRLGYRMKLVPDSCPDCYTLGRFAAEHPQGTYIVGTSGHVVCVQDGTIYDSWNSSNEIALYYFERTM